MLFLPIIAENDDVTVMSTEVNSPQLLEALALTSTAAVVPLSKQEKGNIVKFVFVNR